MYMMPCSPHLLLVSFMLRTFIARISGLVGLQLCHKCLSGVGPPQVLMHKYCHAECVAWAGKILKVHSYMLSKWFDKCTERLVLSGGGKYGANSAVVLVTWWDSEGQVSLRWHIQDL